VKPPLVVVQDKDRHFKEDYLYIGFDCLKGGDLVIKFSFARDRMVES